MNRKWLSLLLAFLMVMPLFVASCGDDDDDSPTGPGGNGDAPPELPQAEINTNVDFQSDDQTAQLAQGLVAGQLGSAQTFSSIPNAFIAPLQGAQWGNQSGNCWSWSATQEGCSVTYQACETTGGIEWSYTANGNCGGSQYNNWVAWRGSTNPDGTAGTFRFFQENSSTVEGGWDWTLTSNGTVGTWNFYDGEIDASNITWTLAWQENIDGSEVVSWTVPDISMWESNVSADGLAGTSNSYVWVDMDWLQDSAIIWNSDGSGSWTNFVQGGEPIVQSW